MTFIKALTIFVIGIFVMPIGFLYRAIYIQFKDGGRAVDNTISDCALELIGKKK